MNKADRSRILEQAFRLCRELGPRKVNAEDIAKQAGVSRATLYNHFRNKTDVICKAIEENLLKKIEEFESILESDTSFQSKVSYAATAQSKFFDEFGDRFLSDLQNASGALLETVNKISSRANDVTIRFLIESQNDGHVRREIEPDTFLVLLEYLALMVTDKRLISRVPENQKRSELLLTYFIEGIKGG